MAYLASVQVLVQLRVVQLEESIDAICGSEAKRKRGMRANIKE